MSDQSTHSYADDAAWKLNEVCEHIRSEIERLGPDSGNHTFRDGRHDAFVMLRAFIQGLERNASKPHFPKEST